MIVPFQNVLLRSCRRQFDNIKRVFKAVEDTPPQQYVGVIVQQFGLSKGLAEKYSAIVFASSSRIELGKKKLSYLPFEEVKNVILLLINNWGDKDDAEAALDRDFLSSLKDLKVHIFCHSSIDFDSIRINV